MNKTLSAADEVELGEISRRLRIAAENAFKKVAVHIESIGPRLPNANSETDTQRFRNALLLMFRELLDSTILLLRNDDPYPAWVLVRKGFEFACCLIVTQKRDAEGLTLITQLVQRNYVTGMQEKTSE